MLNIAAMTSKPPKSYLNFQVSVDAKIIKALKILAAHQDYSIRYYANQIMKDGIMQAIESCKDENLIKALRDVLVE